METQVALAFEFTVLGLMEEDDARFGKMKQSRDRGRGV